MSAALAPISLPVAPHSIEAEQSVLGGLLIDNGAWNKVRDIVTEADFYRDDHRRIFRHIAAVIENGKPADIVTVNESINASEDRDKTGGTAYLAALAANCPSSHNVARYAEIVAEKSQRRQLQALANETHAKAERGDIEGVKTELIERTHAIRTSRGSLAMDWAELAKRGEPPARSWTVAHWIPQGHATLLAGPGGAGKSLLGQQLTSCLTLGVDFIDKIEGRQTCVAWFCEDSHNEIWRRQADIARWRGVSLEAFVGLHLVPRYGLENTLFAEIPGKGLQFTPAMVELRAEVLDRAADVVLIDNVSQVFGAQSADAHHVVTFVNGLAGAMPGRTIILLGHTSRQAGSEFAGSAAWENAARARLYLGRTLPDQDAKDSAEDEAVRYLAKRKANYGARDWRRLTYTDGLLMVDQDSGIGEGGIIGHAREQRAESIVLDGLRKLQALSVRATEGPSSPSYLPRLLIDYKLADGQSKAELGAAMRRLRLAGKIVSATVGKYPNRTPMIGLTVAH